MFTTSSSLGDNASTSNQTNRQENCYANVIRSSTIITSRENVDECSCSPKTFHNFDSLPVEKLPFPQGFVSAIQKRWKQRKFLRTGSTSTLHIFTLFLLFFLAVLLNPATSLAENANSDKIDARATRPTTAKHSGSSSQVEQTGRQTVPPLKSQFIPFWEGSGIHSFMPSSSPPTTHPLFQQLQHKHTRHHQTHRQRHRREKTVHEQCDEGSICSNNNAYVCRNNSCVSACSQGGLKECRCSNEEDNYCYLCCGSHTERCAPAHEHGILRHNGERWERESCRMCRMSGGELDALPCDDNDQQRLCLQGKCSRSVCSAKQQGEVCDRKKEKICVDDVCENPCARIASHLMVCDCPAIDPDTGFASDDRCQLCCFDFNVKPSSRRCQNAYRKWHIESTQHRPIFRVGLDCAHGKHCNRFGVCTNDAALSSRPQWLSTVGSVPFVVITLGFFCFVVAMSIREISAPFCY